MTKADLEVAAILTVTNDIYGGGIEAREDAMLDTIRRLRSALLVAIDALEREPIIASKYAVRIADLKARLAESDGRG